MKTKNSKKKCKPFNKFSNDYAKLVQLNKTKIMYKEKTHAVFGRRMELNALTVNAHRRYYE